MKTKLPTVGIVAAFVLFTLSGAYYPGGYDWRHHFISTLFKPTALNGATNTARPIAVLAMLLLCISIGLLFRQISRHVGSKSHRNTIEIAGIGSMVYAFLVVTPLHDLLVSIALLFFLTATIALLHLLHLERQMRLFCAGTLCLVLLLMSAVMYYGNVYFGLLPVAQKLSCAMCVGWLLALQSVEFKRGAGENVSPHQASNLNGA